MPFSDKPSCTRGHSINRNAMIYDIISNCFRIENTLHNALRPRVTRFPRFVLRRFKRVHMCTCARVRESVLHVSL